MSVTPPPGRARRPAVVAATLLAVVAVGWLLASRGGPAPVTLVRDDAVRAHSAPHGALPVVETSEPEDPALGETPVADAGSRKPLITRAMTPDRMIPSPRNLDDSPHEMQFWEPGMDTEPRPNPNDAGVGVDAPAAEELMEPGVEWHDEEWFGDNRPLPGENE